MFFKNSLASFQAIYKLGGSPASSHIALEVHEAIAVYCLAFNI